ncbi:MAG: hypothetical protein K0S92_1280, partial [Desertimonas sp.]|nr:hypothetical protein [Desertimonas sp.]
GSPMSGLSELQNYGASSSMVHRPSLPTVKHTDMVRQ